MDIKVKNMRSIYLLFLLNLIQLVCGNILDVTCINFNPIYDPGSSASYAAILNGADVTSTVSFQRSVDLDTGMRSSTWCSHDDDATECDLPQGSMIDSSGRVTFRDIDQDKFGAYGCQAERYNWTSDSVTIFLREDALFYPEYLTVTVSLDQEVRLMMNIGSPSGSGSLIWRVNHESGGQTDLSSSVSGNHLYISKANKEDHAGIHHFFYEDQPDQGGLVRLIVKACLDNLWGPDCQYTCPTCYNGGVCDDVSGRCICPPGFSGDHCQTACEVGHFGHDCTGSCSSLESGRTNCCGAVFCLPDPYGCSCAAGWTGLTCDQVCSAGSYGAGCTQTCHCDSLGSCDSVKGACSNGCEDGWTGDQCQISVLDTTALLRQGGVYDEPGEDNFIGIFMIGGGTVTNDPSLKYYIGREVDTGPGETGHGATSGPNGNDITTSWTDTGMPPGTAFIFHDNSAKDSFRAQIDKDSGGDARVGAYRMSVDYRGRTERSILLNEYRGDSNSEVWPVKLSTTVGTGETVVLSVLTLTSVNTASLRWRHNGGSEITKMDGLTSFTLNDVRRSDEGIYECYVEGNRETGRHAIMSLIVRGCPSSKYGFNCSQDCPVCYAGGVCHDVTGECVCRPGFQGDNCETPCSDNHWGKSCSVVCSSANPNCQNRLFSPPNPVGMSCINGYSGNKCQTPCDGSHFGADCELDCNCEGTCDRERGCDLAQCSGDYEGVYCQALRSELDCPSGYFGVICNYPCHCEGDVSCERSNGHCPNGVTCAEGWAGSDCQQALPSLMDLPWVFDVTNDSAVLLWNAWTDGYDYGNGPVHSYQVDYTWTDGDGNTGESDEPIIINGDSTLHIDGLLPFTLYDFYVSVRREVEDQIVAGVRSGPGSAGTDCEAPLLAPVMQEPTVNGMDSITVSWNLPAVPSSSWLMCDPLYYSFILTYWSMNDPTNIFTIPVDGSETARVPVNNLRPCTAYYFSTVIVNSAGLAGPANNTEATTDPLPPGPVEDTHLSSDSFNHLLITWSEPSSQCGTPTYNVTRRLFLRDQCDASSVDKVTWDVVTSTSIEYNDLLPHSTYKFTVLAVLQDFEADYAYRVTYDTAESVPDEAPRNISVNNAEKQTLNFTWDAPSCGKRNGDIVYTYRLYHLSDLVETGTQENTTKHFGDLPNDSAFNFTVCASTSEGCGPCDSLEAETISNEYCSCDINNLRSGDIATIVLGCTSAILGMYSVILTHVYMKLRKAQQKAEGRHGRRNVYQDPKPSSQDSTYEEIRATSAAGTSSEDQSYNNMTMMMSEEEVHPRRREGGVTITSEPLPLPKQSDQEYENSAWA